MRVRRRAPGRSRPGTGRHRALRRAEREASLAVERGAAGSPPARRDRRPCAPSLLRHPDQAKQDLRRRLGVGERTMTRTRVGREAVRERRKVRRLATKQTTGEPDGVDDSAATRRPVARIVSLSRNAMSKRALCATRTASPAKPRKRPDRSLHGRRAPQLGVAKAGQRGDRRIEPRAGVRERLEPLPERELAHAHRADLARPRGSRRSRSSRDRRRRTSRARARVPRPVPLRARRDRPPTEAGVVATASSSSERARPIGTCDPSLRTSRAASSTCTGPRRSSTSSTRRSAASRRSCIRPMLVRTYVRV